MHTCYYLLTIVPNIRLCIREKLTKTNNWFLLLKNFFEWCSLVNEVLFLRLHYNRIKYTFQPSVGNSQLLPIPLSSSAMSIRPWVKRDQWVNPLLTTHSYCQFHSLHQQCQHGFGWNAISDWNCYKNLTDTSALCMK